MGHHYVVYHLAASIRLVGWISLGGSQQLSQPVGSGMEAMVHLPRHATQHGHTVDGRNPE